MRPNTTTSAIISYAVDPAKITHQTTASDIDFSPSQEKKTKIDVNGFCGNKNEYGSYSRIYTAELSREVVKYAENRFENACRYLQVDPLTTTSNRIYRVRHSQIKIDNLIGTGSFHEVYGVKYIRKNERMKNSNNGTHEEEEQEGTPNSSGKNKVVVKMLRRQLLRDPTYFAACAADLIKEGCILASLKHKHILSIRGMPHEGLEGFLSGRHDGFFLLLDRIQDTLRDRLNQWSSKASSLSRHSQSTPLLLPSLSSPLENDDCWNASSSTLNSEMSNRRSSISRAPFGSTTTLRDGVLVDTSDHSHNNDIVEVAIPSFEERLKLLTQIADALRYLHERRIMSRDVKPDNIGFDLATGTLKLFDLDIARILPPPPPSPPTKPNTSTNTMKRRSSISSYNSSNTTTTTTNTTGDGGDCNGGEQQENYLDGYNSLFRLTKKIGPRRYMSPECGRGEPYNLKSDVYSFGLVCHEVLTLSKPFQDFKGGWPEHQRRVFFLHERPKIPSTATAVSSTTTTGTTTTTAIPFSDCQEQHEWSFDLSSLVKSCWSHEIVFRPTMYEVHDRLKGMTGL